MKIPTYTKGIVQPRATPQMVDYNAVSSASATAKAVGQAADIGLKLADAHQKANETTLFNDANIRFQKEALIYNESARKQNQDNPFGYSKRAEDDIKKIAEKYEKELPSERARKAWRESVAQQNLSYFKSNLSWENKRSTQIYAERTERAAKNLQEMAYLAGRNGEDIGEIQKNVAATAVSVGTFQPDRETMRKVNERIGVGASSAYLRGLSENDPVKAFELINSGAFDKTIPMEKLDKFRKGVAQDAINQVAMDDVEEAQAMLESESFKGVFSPKEHERYKKTLDKAREQQEIYRNTQVAIHTNNVMTRVASGEITAAGIEADDTLTAEEKSLAAALMRGDFDTINEITAAARGAGAVFENIDSATILDSVEAIKTKAVNAEGKRSVIKESAQQLNALSKVAAAAHANNKSNRGVGLTKAEYNAVLKQISAVQEAIGSSSDYDMVFTRNPFDVIVDEIDAMKLPPKEKARMIGYATSIAETSRIDVFQKMSQADSIKAIKPILEEIQNARKSSLGIKPSAPQTKSVIKDGVKENLGGEEGKGVVADRSVNPQGQIKFLGIKE